MQEKQLSDKGLLGGVIFSMFLWGLSWPSGKVLTKYCSAVNFTVYRYTLVITALLLLLSLLGISMKVKKEGIPAFVVSGVLLAIYSYCLFMGLKTGSAGAGGVLVTTLNPLLAYFIGIVLSRRYPSGNEAAGLVLGIAAGCVLLKVWDNSAHLLESGNLYFLLGALTWATMSRVTSKGAKYGSSLGFSLWQYLVTLLCWLPFTHVDELQMAIHITDHLFWINLLFSSVIVTAIATTVYFYTTTRLGAERASSFIFLVPLAAAVSSWLLLDEHIKVHTAVGGLLGIAAVYTINKKKRIPAGVEQAV
jgi:drug/metabolite transporter (DMT)-like permease